MTSNRENVKTRKWSHETAGELVGVRLQPDAMHRIDRFRAQEADILSRFKVWAGAKVFPTVEFFRKPCCLSGRQRSENLLPFRDAGKVDPGNEVSRKRPLHHFQDGECALLPMTRRSAPFRLRSSGHTGKRPPAFRSGAGRLDVPDPLVCCFRNVARPMWERRPPDGLIG
jgi:hypothetical protein